MWRKKAEENTRQEVEYLRKQNTELIQIVAKTTNIVNTIFEEVSHHEEKKKKIEKQKTEPEPKMVPIPTYECEASIEVKKEELLKPVTLEEQEKAPHPQPEVVTGNFLTEKPKRAYHRHKQQVKGKRIRDTTADHITKAMNTPIIQHRYEVIIDYLHGGGQSKIPDLVQSTNISTNSVKAHLRYGVETGTMDFKKKRGKLRLYWLTEQGETLWRTIAPQKPSITEVDGKFDNSGYLKIPKKEGL